jgi:hypothetical protein
MLEAIRQFTEEQLAVRGDAAAAHAAHARHFAEREDHIMAIWDSPRQREAYISFIAELANLRTAFRWAADHEDLDTAATIATYAAFLGLWIENYEAIAWFAFSPLTAAAIPEFATAIAHLRNILGDQTYESLATKGERMNTAEMVACAYDQIDQVRAELEAVSK